MTFEEVKEKYTSSARELVQFNTTILETAKALGYINKSSIAVWVISIVFLLIGCGYEGNLTLTIVFLLHALFFTVQRRFKRMLKRSEEMSAQVTKLEVELLKRQKERIDPHER